MIRERLEAFGKYTRDLALRHERRALAGALIVGALWDYVTLTDPRSLYGNTVIVAYLSIIAGVILILNRRKAAGQEERVYLLVLMQFCFGNLASGLLILYSQSGTLAGSWLFFASLLAFLIGNEFLRGRYSRVYLQLAALTGFLFAYLALIAPVLLNRIDVVPFLISSALVAILMAGFVALLYRVAAEPLKARARQSVVAVGAVFLFFNALYFLNLIPPVPLALKDIGVYHSVTRTGDGYVSLSEEARWYDVLRRLGLIFTYTKGERAYCFSSIYAPVKLSAPIYHKWEHFDVGRGVWDMELRILFPISGGREEGYRGYSAKQIDKEGFWRCTAQTQRGATVGSKLFYAKEAKERPRLVEVTK